MEGRWIPNTGNSEKLKNSGGALIHKAKEEFMKRSGLRLITALSDSIGVMGYVFPGYILCAKEYVYGWVVSCHESLVMSAAEHDLKVIMYIHKVDKFYVFRPEDIKIKGTINQRLGINMINFDIRLGVAYERVKIENNKQDQAV
jgi:hypothetical protein